MDPGRFSIIETKNSTEGKVEMKAKFPWGLTTVEIIQNHGTKFFSSLSLEDIANFEVSSFFIHFYLSDFMYNLWINFGCIFFYFSYNDK